MLESLHFFDAVLVLSYEGLTYSFNVRLHCFSWVSPLRP